MALKLTQLGQVTVTSAGTRVQITATSTPTYYVTIQADPGNSGTIYVGDSSVSSTVCAAALSAGASIRIEGPKYRNSTDEVVLSDIYVDASANSQKVNVGYLKNRN